MEEGRKTRQALAYDLNLPTLHAFVLVLLCCFLLSVLWSNFGVLLAISSVFMLGMGNSGFSSKLVYRKYHRC